MNSLKQPLSVFVRNYGELCSNTKNLTRSIQPTRISTKSKIDKFHSATKTPIFSLVSNKNPIIISNSIFQKQLYLSNHNESIQAAAFHTSSSLHHGRKFAMERREKKAKKNKLLKEARLAKNPRPIPHKIQLMLAAKGLGGPPRPIREKDDKKFVADNVYFMEDCAWKRWKFEEAIKELRLCNHPSLGYSNPEGLVIAKIELNLKANKRDQYMDGFTTMTPITHAYDRGIPDKSICAFVTSEAMGDEAVEAGAIKTGGEELIKEVAKGRVDISDIDRFVAHEDILASVNTLAGVLRDKQPNRKDGTVGTDIPLLVSTFSRGMDITVKKVKPTLGYADEPDYGFCEATIGRLDMDADKLEDNLTVVINSLNEKRPLQRKDKDETFITRCILKVEGKTSKGEEFTIIHPGVTDERVSEQDKVITEGRKIISERVSMLKEKQNRI